MLILSADTSGKQGSIALSRAEAGEGVGSVRVIAVVPLAGGTFSAQLVPQIATLLARHGFTKTDIDAFVVASGPGSFTGLRVGLAAIKGLAEILQKPIAAVSLLEVLAREAGEQGRVIAALDAGRRELYAGDYEIGADRVREVEEELLSREQVLEKARAAILATPELNLAEAAKLAGVRVVVTDPVNAGKLATLGWRKIRDGEVVTPDKLEANYIRRSDAEIFAKKA